MRLRFHKALIAPVSYGCAMLGCVGVGQLTGISTRHIHLVVHIAQSDGPAIGGLPISCGPSNGGMWAKTDVAGRAVLEGDVADTVIFVSVNITPLSKEDSLDAMQADSDRYAAVVQQWAFRKYYMVALIAGQTDYDLSIAATPATTITGHVVDDQGLAVKATVCGRDGVDLVGTDKATGGFSVRGLSTTAANELFVSTVDTGRVLTRPLTAQEMVVGGDIGNIVVAPMTRGSGITITVTHREDLPEKVTPRDKAVSLIRTDGQQLWSFPIRPDGQAVRRTRSSESPTVPPGTYYVSPGWFGDNRTSMALLDAVRAGRLAEVDAAGVPRIAVTESGGQAEVNLMAAECAIFTLGGER